MCYICVYLCRVYVFVCFNLVESVCICLYAL